MSSKKKYKKIAFVDIGSNTFLYSIVKYKTFSSATSFFRKFPFQILQESEEYVQLFEGLSQKNRFTEDALGRAEKAISRFSLEFEEQQVEKVFAVATSATREAENREELLSLCKQKNWEVEVISGEREAQISFLGATYKRKNKQGCMIVDVGGGSTEIFLKSNKDVFFSLPLGGVRLRDQFQLLPVPEKIIEEIKSFQRKYKETRLFIRKEIQKKDWASFEGKVQEVFLVGGCPLSLSLLLKSNLSFLKKDRRKIEQDFLTQDQSYFEEKKIPLKRISVLPAGFLCLDEILNQVSCQKISITPCGVRHGMMVEFLEKNK